MRLVLLGDPVEHSLSPAIHGAALTAAGIAGEYTVRRVDAAGVRGAFDEIRRGELDGANVTMPHKRVAHDLCSELDRDAARAGAVNTVVRDGDALHGWNTDVIGLRTLLAAMPAGPLLVLGAGGAAAGAVVAGAGRRILVSNRRGDGAQRLVATTGIPCEVHEWGRSVSGAVVVNSTPLGMTGESLPAGIVEDAAGLIDLAYGAKTTPAVALARSGGIACADGVDALIEQAVHSFAIWTGIQPERSAMRAAIPAV